jgi:hypothetical protein
MLRKAHRASPPRLEGTKCGEPGGPTAGAPRRLVPVSNIAVFTCDQKQVFVMFLDWNIEAADERHAGPARKATARLR